MSRQMGIGRISDFGHPNVLSHFTSGPPRSARGPRSLELLIFPPSGCRIGNSGLPRNAAPNLSPISKNSLRGMAARSCCWRSLQWGWPCGPISRVRLSSRLARSYLLLPPSYFSTSSGLPQWSGGFQNSRKDDGMEILASDQVFWRIPHASATIAPVPDLRFADNHGGGHQ